MLRASSGIEPPKRCLCSSDPRCAYGITHEAEQGSEMIRTQKFRTFEGHRTATPNSKCGPDKTS